MLFGISLAVGLSGLHRYRSHPLSIDNIILPEPLRPRNTPNVLSNLRRSRSCNDSKGLPAVGIFEMTVQTQPPISTHSHSDAKFRKIVATHREAMLLG